MRLLTVLSVSLLVLLAGACSDDSTGDAGIISDTAPTDDSSDPDTDTDTAGDPDTGGDTTSSTDGGDAGGGASESVEQAGSGLTPSPGQCGVDELNRQHFYAVDNIPADDPDGGLNVRDDYEGGEVLTTLPVGTVVFVEDCFLADDGGVWFAVDTSEVAGWVNSAFLSEDIPVLTPTFGGTETEAALVALLDALAAREWDEAAAQMIISDVAFAPFAQQLPEDQADLPDALEAYCATRVCDAPYTVTDVRGSYMPERVSPEVDVEFIYSGGVVSETFTRVSGPDDFVIASLPGRSILSLASSPRPTAELVDSFDPADEGLYEAAEQLRQALLSEQGPRIPADFFPPEGIAVSTDAYIDPSPERRAVVTASDLSSGADERRIWGYADGIGTAIVDTVEGRMAGYRRSLPLLEPDVVGIDRRVGLGNTIDNLAAEFPEARIVEFHREGRGLGKDFNWSSVRMALEQRDGEWKLVGLTSDTWTI